MATGWQSIDNYLRAKGVRIGPPRANQTTGGLHGPTSYHPRGLARDYGDVDSDCRAVVAALLPLAQGAGAPITELFYTPTGTFYDNGKVISPSASLSNQHRDHVHVAIRSGVDLMDYENTVGTPSLGAPSKESANVSNFLGSLVKHETAMRVVKVIAGAVLIIVPLGMVIAE